MGFLDGLFRRKGGQEAAATTPKASPAGECPHAAVTPRWDNAADLGKTDLVSAYVCDACHATFSREEGQQMTAAAADRLRVSEDVRQEGMER